MKVQVIKEYQEKNGSLVTEFGYVNSSCSYRMMFEEEMGLMMKLSNRAMRLMYFILHNYNEGFYTHVGFWDSAIKWLESHDCSLSRKGLQNCFPELYKHKLIIRTARNHFYINPVYYYSGPIKDRSKFVQQVYQDSAIYRMKKRKQELVKQEQKEGNV